MTGYWDGPPPRAMLIAGPTACGKSVFALGLAERFGGTIVNADSMQIYRDLRILTARPSAQDEARIPHRLYGVVDATEEWSVGRWLQEVESALREITSAGRVPIVVGGTGLYFRALTEGLAKVPPIPVRIRSEIRRLPTSELRRRLEAADPVMAARLRPRDTCRNERALEVIEATGRSLADWQADSGEEPLLAGDDVHRVVIAPDRRQLHARIARRFASMMEEGALAEVEAIVARGLPPNAGVMKAIGVRPLSAYLRGELGREEAIERAVIETRQYAKRQMTWFTNKMRSWPRL